MFKNKGICLDIVVPSYRVDNEDFLRRIVLLRATVDVYVKFWIGIDNLRHDHIESVTKMANELNEQQLQVEGNYFINVIHYGANRGASYARNTGFNYTTADWVLFLDDDVIPDENILDAYIGAIKRYPCAKVFVGLTELPESCNLWTEMLLCTCNIGYFYAIAKRRVHPSWGVTANLVVRGSRHNSTIQFKDIYPKTGGGEDIDLVYQFKDWYRTIGRRVTVGIPEAKAQHP
jgi:glycosyltransferase involved in cell wall biosynthesis